VTTAREEAVRALAEALHNRLPGVYPQSSIAEWSYDIAKALSALPDHTLVSNERTAELERLSAGIDWRVVAPVLRAGTWRAMSSDEMAGSMFLREWMDAAEKAHREAQATQREEAGDQP
jgi:hypothetical protein